MQGGGWNPQSRRRAENHPVSTAISSVNARAARPAADVLQERNVDGVQ